METRRLRIRGRVQGVGYRASLSHEAVALGLKGWVRNRTDGSVEAVACGEAAALDALERWCRSGTSLARVDSVEASLDQGSFDAFRTLPTL